jgi:hypothetical protein
MFGEFGCNKGVNTIDGYENQRSFYDVSFKRFWVLIPFLTVLCLLIAGEMDERGEGDDGRDRGRQRVRVLNGSGKPAR